jgi:hypothetical protein
MHDRKHPNLEVDDLDLINRFVHELDAEIEDVLRYQTAGWSVGRRRRAKEALSCDPRRLCEST